MSVPTWKRTKSKTQYIYTCFELNKEVARIMTKVPKKYRTNYSDEIIKECMEALKHLQMGNDIVVGNKEYLLLARVKHLSEAIGILDNVLTITYIFFEMMKEHNELRNDWIDRSEEIIGNYCDSIIRMTKKVIEKDKLAFNSYYGNRDK